jgi:hypothetical protein
MAMRANKRVDGKRVEGIPIIEKRSERAAFRKTRECLFHGGLLVRGLLQPVLVRERTATR